MKINSGIEPLAHKALSMRTDKDLRKIDEQSWGTFTNNFFATENINGMKGKTFVHQCRTERSVRTLFWGGEHADKHPKSYY